MLNEHKSFFRSIKRLLILLSSWKFYMKSSGQHGNQNTIRIFKEVNDFKAVEKLLRGSGIEVPEKYKERIAEGDKFVCTLDAHQKVFSYGWSTRRSVMPLSEVGLLFRNDNSTVLYDFYTPAIHRRQGQYTSLLQYIGTTHSDQQYWIYAHKNNPASWRAIERAGFQRQSLARLILQNKFCELVYDHK